MNVNRAFPPITSMTNQIPLTAPSHLQFQAPFPLAQHVSWWTEHWQEGLVTIPSQMAMTADLLFSSEGFAFSDPLADCLFSSKLRTQEPIITASAPLKFVEEAIISLSQDGYPNYYHWMTELLPKLRFLDQLDPEEEALIALPSSGPAFIKESLNSLLSTSRHKRKVLWLEQGVLYRSARGIKVIAPAPLFGFVPNDVIKFLQENFSKAHDPITTIIPSTASKRIFVSRNRASRRILNEDQIFAELFAPLNFTFHLLDTLPLSSQILLFHGAEVVAGEHGAAFTNILFSKPGSLLIEIFQRREDASFYYLTQGRWRWVGIKTVEFEETGAMNWEKNEQVTVPIEPIRLKLQELQANGDL